MQNKPKLRFKEFNNEWNSTTFDKVFKTIQNNCFSRDLLNGTDEKCTKNVHYGDILIKYGTILDCDNITLPSIDSTVDLKKFNEESYLKDGDILIADTAEDYTVGKACEIVNVHDKVLSGLHTIPCRPLFDFASRFLGYYINSYSYHDSLIPLVTGIKVSSISKSSIAKTIVKYPSIDEQKKIAELLSKVDEVIAEREEEVKDLEKQKKGLMQKIFSGQLRFTDSNNNPYPDWEEYRLKDILAQVIDNRGKTPPLADNGYPLLEIASMGNNRINYSKISKYVDNETYKKFFRGYIEYGDVLFSTVGFYAGEVSYYDKQIDCTIAQNIVGLRFKGNNSLFMTYLLSEPKNKKRIKAIEMNQAQPSIKVTQFVELKFKVPCLEEQQKIANILSKLDELIEEKKALLSDWQSFKKGLLQQMFV